MIRFKWTDKRKADFVKYYAKKSQEELFQYFNKSITPEEKKAGMTITIKAIKSMAGNAGIKKRNRGWTKQQEHQLLAKYLTTDKSELEKLFGKKRFALHRKYVELTGMTIGEAKAAQKKEEKPVEKAVKRTAY